MFRKFFALSAVLATVFAFSSDAEARNCCRQKRTRCHRQRHCCQYVAPCNVCNSAAAAAPAAEAPAAEAAPAPEAK